MRRRLWIALILPIFLHVETSSAALNCQGLFIETPTFKTKLKTFAKTSIDFFIKNLTYIDTDPGAVIAGTSKADPNYFYHWVRDAALAVETAEYIYKLPLRWADKAKLIVFFLSHIEFNKKIQGVVNLGEPKFNPDGTVFSGDWARPQNDGPALRAVSLIKIHDLIKKQNWQNAEQISRLLYDGTSSSIIKKDLEFVAHNWKNDTFDLWEEIKGVHFYNLMVYRRSLIEGAEFARRKLDPGAADFYILQAKLIEKEIEKTWSSEKKIFGATLSRSGGIDYKNSNLDVAVILGVLHGDFDGSFLKNYSDKILSTAHRLRESFVGLYGINGNKDLGTALGRYPEDTYDGYVVGKKGNPWVLCTAAFAELYYRVAFSMKKQKDLVINETNIEFYNALLGEESRVSSGEIIKSADSRFARIIEALAREGDKFLARVMYHANADGSLSEQFNRDSGHMQGATHLTWSHASIISANYWRERLLGRLP